MKFTKYHALGNDYLVLDPADESQLPSPAQIQTICHRNFGLGSDGILYGPIETDEADFALQIWNPDGSEAEKSGNGLRIFSRYLYDSGLVQHEAFSVKTLGGIVSCVVCEGAKLIEVEMGKVSFDSDDIPVSGEAREVIDESIKLNGLEYRFCAATIGNPHVVLPLDDISAELAHQLGPLIENKTELFSNRTNVQFMKVLDRNNIQIEIWERGAGYTLASGSSSSVAAAVAKRIGACDNDITVHCPGGDIEIQLSDDYEVKMSGSVTRVGVFEMEEEVFA